jgi:hypothetical protein
VHEPVPVGIQGNGGRSAASAPEAAPGAPRYDDLPAVVEHDLSSSSHDDLDVPDFLK